MKNFNYARCLFPTADQKAFLRTYCENSLRAQSVSYFSGQAPLRCELREDEIMSFVLDDRFLIIFFQPYTVGGLGDGPLHVKIPYELLRERWKDAHPLSLCLDRMIISKSYTASWDF